MPHERPRTWLLPAILIVGLTLRLVAALWWQSRLPADRPFLFGDSESYWHLARAIADGQPYQYGGPDAKIFRTPGYPLLLSPLFLIAGPDPPVFAARVMSVLCGCAAIAAVSWLGRLLFGRQVGLLAAAMLALYPGAIVLSVVVLSEAPFVPLVLLHLALWALAWQVIGCWKMALTAVAAGLAAAAATLVRPSWLLFVPFVLVIGLAYSQRRKHLIIAGCALLGLGLGMLPWWIRNAWAVGHFVPTTLQVGASLYDGLNPRADGSSNMWFVEPLKADLRRAASDEPLEYRLDGELRRAAFRWTSEHPAAACELAWIKLVRMWNIWPNEPQFRSWPLRLLVALTYTPLLALGIVGAWRSRHAGLRFGLCWLPAVYLTLLHIVFVSSIRYREPAMMPLAVLAAATLLGAAPKPA
jgi:4-amino-4-deoxy-L-arabinose transferase-like glycosyltransferase